MSKHQNIVYKTNLKYQWEKNTRKWRKISIFSAGQFQFDAFSSFHYRDNSVPTQKGDHSWKCAELSLKWKERIYSMIFDFVSWSVYWQLTLLFTSCIGQLWNLARLNDVRGISMIAAKIRERQKQVTARYWFFFWTVLLYSFGVCFTMTFIYVHITWSQQSKCIPTK